MFLQALQYILPSQSELDNKTIHKNFLRVIRSPFIAPFLHGNWPYPLKTLIHVEMKEKI